MRGASMVYLYVCSMSSKSRITEVIVLIVDFLYNIFFTNFFIFYFRFINSILIP